MINEEKIKALREEFHTFFQNMKGDKYEFEIADFWLQKHTEFVEEVRREIRNMTWFYGDEKGTEVVNANDLLALPLLTLAPPKDKQI